MLIFNQGLHQGPYSVEEYHKEMEMDLLRAQIKESEEAKMARFLHSLKREIQDVGKEKEKYGASREKSPKKGSEASIGQKELTPISTPMPPRASSIKCFKCLGKEHIASQCPNRSVMIGSESSIGKVDTSSESKSLSDGSHYEGDLLMVVRLMNM
ncbi:hypothetical protein CR513_03388, partial [Mucuna pruriens]